MTNNHTPEELWAFVNFHGRGLEARSSRRLTELLVDLAVDEPNDEVRANLACVRRVLDTLEASL